MSSGLLYLAIVGVWAGVLVPMWVRRSDIGEARGDESADPPLAPRGHGRARARVVARRRRRLSGITLFFIVTVAIAAAGIAPWWIVPVPGLALVGYLACLRAAATYDLELAERDRRRDEGLEQGYEPEQAAADEAAYDIEQEGDAVSADPRVIEFPLGGVRAGGRAGARDELFDQYADEHRRAAGEH